MKDNDLADAICSLTCAVIALGDQLRHQNNNQAVLSRIAAMEERMAIQVSEVKAAVAAAAKNNKEAFAEIGTKIADLNKQIQDLIAGVGDPTIDDATFEADLKSLGVDSAALAEIVPGSPTPEPTPE